MDRELIPTIFEGWRHYQEALVKAIEPLRADELRLSAPASLRTVGEIAAHIIGARARWFYLLMGEGEKAFKEMGNWDRRGRKARTAAELVRGLNATWRGMHEAIGRWNSDDGQKSRPGEDNSEPEVIMRQWVLWHLIEHDLHHGGEISIILGVQRLPGLDLKRLPEAK